MIKLTILSEKLPELTNEQFKHEFREVHANQTKGVATNLGIILKYVQGLALPLVGQKSLPNLPLKEGKDCHSYAQLTWPALAVMQGSFLTEDYRNSAGKHRFASPQMIFLTEQLDQIHGIESKSGDEICVVVVVQAKSEGSDFEKRWATHASYCLSICPKYTRNRVVPLKYSQIGTIFAGTQFDPSRVVASGGYEEFCFGGHAEAEDFFHRYGNKLGESYSQFLDDTQSCCYAFDRLVQFADSDRGLWQKAFGLVVSTGLRAKVYWGLP